VQLRVSDSGITDEAIELLVEPSPHLHHKLVKDDPTIDHDPTFGQLLLNVFNAFRGDMVGQLKRREIRQKHKFLDAVVGNPCLVQVERF
jgi:hypothetical protein